MFAETIEKFTNDFIVDQRWRFITEGLKTTIIVTLLALIVGLLLGAIIAVIRTAHDQLRDEKKAGLGKVILGAANAVCQLYLE